jgi:hypothetical protein
MTCGLVSPKSIGLINREHINELVKTSKLMFEFLKFLINVTSFAAFSVSGIPLILNSLGHLYLLEIFWIALFTVFVYFTAEIYFSQMTYFYIICLYLKLKLRNTNNSIRKSFETKFIMTYNGMKNILKQLDSIISEINTYNNDLCSKYLMIVFMLVIIALDLVFFDLTLKKISFFIKIKV